MKLRDYRTVNGLTLDAFAERVGVTGATISRYESGRVPEPSILERIYDATSGVVGPEDFYPFMDAGSAA